MFFKKTLFRGLCRTSRTCRTRPTIAQDWSWREICGIFPWHFPLHPGLRALSVRSVNHEKPLFHFSPLQLSTGLRDTSFRCRIRMILSRTKKFAEMRINTDKMETIAQTVGVILMIFHWSANSANIKKLLTNDNDANMPFSVLFPDNKAQEANAINEMLWNSARL